MRRDGGGGSRREEARFLLNPSATLANARKASQTFGRFWNTSFNSVPIILPRIILSGATVFSQIAVHEQCIERVMEPMAGIGPRNDLLSSECSERRAN